MDVRERLSGKQLRIAVIHAFARQHREMPTYVEEAMNHVKVIDWRVFRDCGKEVTAERIAKFMFYYDVYPNVFCG